MTLTNGPIENIFEKGESADNQHFLLFTQCFLLSAEQILVFQSHLFYSLQVLSVFTSLNPFPHDKILDLTKLKAFADDKLNVSKMIISVFDRVENIVEKGEIVCTSNFSFSHNVFKRLLPQRRQKVSLCGNELNFVFWYHEKVQLLAYHIHVLKKILVRIYGLLAKYRQ